MSITVDNSIIIIDLKTTTVGEVQSRIAELQAKQPEVDAAFKAASARQADVHNELEKLTSALKASGFPTS